MFRVRSAAKAMKISGELMISKPAEWCSPIQWTTDSQTGSDANSGATQEGAKPITKSRVRLLWEAGHDA